MKFSDAVRTRHSGHDRRLTELEEFFAKYDERFKRRYTSQATRPGRLLGHRAAQLLLTSLSRARFLTGAFIHCANGGLAAAMYLAARAHWEMTGLVAHLLGTLRRFYGAQIAEAELDATLARLALGRRWEIPDNLKEDVTAINAITLVGSAAKLLGDGKIEKHVNDAYAFLSEHCHPNLFGRMTGVTISADLRIVEYDPSFILDDRDLGTCLTHGNGSHGLFLFSYDECFRLLNANEEMPTLEA